MLSANWQPFYSGSNVLKYLFASILIWYIFVSTKKYTSLTKEFVTPKCTIKEMGTTFHLADVISMT